MTSTDLLTYGAVCLVVSVVAWLLLGLATAAMFDVLLVLSLCLAGAGLVLLACGVVARLIALGVREGR